MNSQIENLFELARLLKTGLGPLLQSNEEREIVGKCLALTQTVAKRKLGEVFARLDSDISLPGAQERPSGKLNWLDRGEILPKW